MNRPLLITDCDEVLLHMVVPFRDWPDERHDVHFELHQFGLPGALRRKATGLEVERGHIWEMLEEFFETEMHRQQPIAGALEAVRRISAVADVVVLTNIGERAHLRRIDQLQALGINCPVHWNQGGKGPPLAAIVADFKPSIAIFVDDLAQHHESVEAHAPDVWRLHMVGEPLLAPNVAIAPRAHARIDQWEEAEAWIAARIADGLPARDQPALAQVAKAP